MIIAESAERMAIALERIATVLEAAWGDYVDDNTGGAATEGNAVAKITLNGRVHHVPYTDHRGGYLTYEAVCGMAGLVPGNNPTVTWRHQAMGLSGIMMPGRKIILRDGLVINAGHTGGA